MGDSTQYCTAIIQARANKSTQTTSVSPIAVDSIERKPKATPFHTAKCGRASVQILFIVTLATLKQP